MEMSKLDKVIKGLEYCIKSEDCRGCIYWEEIGLHEGCPLNADALALLKEQEAVEPIPYHRSDGTIFKYECRKCRTKIFKMDLFCRHCGQAVKWE